MVSLTILRRVMLVGGLFELLLVGTGHFQPWLRPNLLFGCMLIAGVMLQVRVGLRPLFRLQREVAAVRTGKTDRLAGDYPAELEPLASELNALVAHNQEVVERQRTHVGKAGDLNEHQQRQRPHETLQQRHVNLGAAPGQVRPSGQASSSATHGAARVVPPTAALLD